MTQTSSLRKLQRSHWRSLEKLLRTAYRDGYDAGLARAHGQARRGRTVRADATVEGLVRLVERHFGLDRYGFEVRIVHATSGRRVPAADRIGRYLRDDD
jgi:hypothetical protein